MTEHGDRPRLYVFGGPNGAGKSTLSQRILADVSRAPEFVNADVIARGLAGLDPDIAAFAAGRVMLAHMRELLREKRTFAFESTLSSKTFAAFLQRAIDDGYYVELTYVWLSSAALAVKRVKHRFATGGHFIPEAVVRRRYPRSACNARWRYFPLVDRWRVYDNSEFAPRLVAEGGRDHAERVYDSGVWKRFLRASDAS